MLPEASFAVTVTAVVPSGNCEPEAGLLVTVTAETESLLLTLNVTGAEEAPGAATATMSGGHSTEGAVVSRTVTLKVPVALLPAESVAVTLTAVVPTGKVLPGWWL